MSTDPESTDPTPEQAEQQAHRDAVIQPLIKTMTQREKYLLADRLERPYSAIMEDPDRIMVALAWKKLKTENSGIAPSFDELLDKTDEDILAILGLDDLGEQEVEAAGEG